MKITNHNKGNYHYVDDSVMYGNVEMNGCEWEAVEKWLYLRTQSAIEYNQTYQRDSLVHVIAQLDRSFITTSPFCIGVEATRLMFEAFGLPRYKRQNYSITVTN